VYACGRQYLAADGEGWPGLPASPVEACNACGHCSAVCPVGALISPNCGGERASPYPAAPDVDFGGAKRFLLSCRSIRRYKEQPVAERDILEILDVARNAPSGGNLQPVSWAVLSGRKKAEEFTALTMECIDKVLRHSDPLFKARADNMLKRYGGGYDIILRGAPNAVFALTDRNAGWGAVDSAIAVAYFCLAAHARGVGSCWCGFGLSAIRAYKPLRDLMGFDDSVAVQGMAFFGYPDIAYTAAPPRKALRVAWVKE
jgi:nitroreductase